MAFQYWGAPGIPNKIEWLCNFSGNPGLGSGTAGDA